MSITRTITLELEEGTWEELNKLAKGLFLQEYAENLFAEAVSEQYKNMKEEEAHEGHDG